MVYQVRAIIYPAQDNQILVHARIFTVEAPAIPVPSLVSFGNFHTLRRYFPTPEQAQVWSEHLKSAYAKGPVKNPLLDGGQVFLF